MSDKVYCGIDLGKKGSLVFLQNGKIVQMVTMPLIADEDVDVSEIAKLLINYDHLRIHVVFEKFAGFFGYSKGSAVSLARQGGMIEAVLIMLNIPYTKIQPQVWQRVIWEGTTIHTKTDGKKDTKKISLLTASRLFPGESFLATPKCKKPNDGLIDGALLAEFGRRKNL